MIKHKGSSSMAVKTPESQVDEWRRKAEREQWKIEEAVLPTWATFSTRWPFGGKL